MRALNELSGSESFYMTISNQHTSIKLSRKACDVVIEQSFLLLYFDRSLSSMTGWLMPRSKHFIDWTSSCAYKLNLWNGRIIRILLAEHPRLVTIIITAKPSAQEADTEPQASTKQENEDQHAHTQPCQESFEEVLTDIVVVNDIIDGAVQIMICWVAQINVKLSVDIGEAGCQNESKQRSPETQKKFW